jgi:hypothetical protein
VEGLIVTKVDLLPVVDDDHWAGWTPHSEKFQRRRRNVIALVTVPLVVASVFKLLSYNPLQQSYSGPYSDGLTTASGGQPVLGHEVATAKNSTLARSFLYDGVIHSEQPATFWIEPAGHYTVHYEATITNRSFLSITIEKLYAPLVNPRGAHVRTYFHNSSISSEQGKPFHPVSLGAHDRLSIIVAFRQPCVPSQNTTSSGVVGSMPVRYSMLGISHTTTVPILPFGIQSRMSC